MMDPMVTGDRLSGPLVDFLKDFCHQDGIDEISISVTWCDAIRRVTFIPPGINENRWRMLANEDTTRWLKDLGQLSSE